MIQRFLFALLFLALPLQAAPARSTKAAQGVVSAADPRAAAAGAEILRAGGSAADAAIAMMLALNVVEPQSSGIGGGGFMVHHDARTLGTTSFDGREEAPAAADPYWFYRNGQPLSHRDAIPGGRSVGVPGNLRMMALAHAKYGRLPWKRLFQPAIKLAREGWTVSPRFYSMAASFGPGLLSDNAFAQKLFFQADGKPKSVGSLLRNPDQADLFERIAAHGPDYFYVGPPAESIVPAVNGAARNPSKMTKGDLVTYSAKERAPICGTYRIYRICGMGPPSAGGIAVLTILKQLERFDMARLGKDSPVAWHLFAESSRLAYADRDAYLGDADHVTVPIAGLIDPAYIASRAELISPDRTMASVTPGMPQGAPARVRAPEGHENGTSSMTAVDRHGNVAEVTSTIESVFGSGLMVHGIFLNNELTDFNIVPGQNGYLTANSVAGGKRPRSSMSPTIVYGPDGKVRIAIGAAGGSTIIAQVAKALVGVLDWGMSAQDAIALGLVYAPGPTAVLEQGTQAAAMAPGLQALGEKVTVAPLGLKLNAVEWSGGRWVGAADPRSEGVAVAEDGTVSEIVRAVPLSRPPE